MAVLLRTISTLRIILLTVGSVVEVAVSMQRQFK